jgi:hypothetical protein
LLERWRWNGQWTSMASSTGCRHASWNPVIAGRGNGHMGKDHINDLNHQDCTILHLKIIMNMVIEWHWTSASSNTSPDGSWWMQHDHRLVNEAWPSEAVVKWPGGLGQVHPSQYA